MFPSKCFLLHETSFPHSIEQFKVLTSLTIEKVKHKYSFKIMLLTLGKRQAVIKSTQNTGAQSPKEQVT